MRGSASWCQLPRYRLRGHVLRQDRTNYVMDQNRTSGELSARRPQAEIIRLVQLRVLRFGLLVDRNVRVGVFPEGKEVFVGGERLQSGGSRTGALRVLRL